MRAAIVATLAATALVAAGCGDDDDDEGSSVEERAGLVVLPGEGSVDATVRRIQRAAEAGDATVSVIDHAAAARQADLDLPPTTLLLVGNPAVGTPLMEEARTTGIDLPLKMLVWENDDGDVRIAYNEPAFLADRHGLTEQDERLDAIAETLRTLATGE